MRKSRRSYWQKHKLRSQLVLFNLIITVFVVIILSFFIYNFNISFFINNVTEVVSLLFNQTEDRIEQYLRDIRYFLDSIFTNREIAKLIKQKSAIDNQKIKTLLMEKKKTIILLKNYI